MPVAHALKLVESNKFLKGAGEPIAKKSPSLELTMEQGRLGLEAWQYASFIVFSSLFFGIIIFSIIALIGSIRMPAQALHMALGFGLLTSFAIVLYALFYPQMIIIKRVRELEKGTLFALRHMLIRIRSGVSLFDAMASIAKGGYGVVSDEFERTVRKMGAGMEQAQSMDDMALSNPSQYFRRVIWQLANAMKTGAEITEVLQHLVDGLSFDQRIKIRESGAQMNPIALMYMMFTVILPSMGIVFIIALTLFMGINIPNSIFYVILGALIMFQYVFVGIVKNRRPSVDL